MKIVQKGNKQLRIDDTQLNDYLVKGYAELDQKTGKLIEKKPTDEFKALKKENAELKKANKELRDQLDALVGGTEK